jgi:hypothetical protein
MATSFNGISDALSALLITSGFVESKETITLDELPSSISDKAFSILLDSTDSGSLADINDRFFPIHQVKITAIYFIGNNSFSRYEGGISWNEDLISLVMNPSNYAGYARQINFGGSAVQNGVSSEARNYVVIENTFSVEVDLLYVPELTDNVYTDTTTDETIDAGTY